MNKIQMFSTQLFILFLFFTFCKLEINVKDVNLTDSEMSLFSENKSYFHFIPDPQISKCIKIIVEEVNNNKTNEDDYINHIISYYKDSEFNEREQLAQSVSDTTIMWLNQKQIQEDFYISVECAKTPCNSSIHIIPEANPILHLGQQYTYYITEDNKDLTFLIDMDLQNKKFAAENNTFLIYARGSKYLNTKLNEDEPTYQKEGYHVFIRNIEEVEKFKSFNFNVKSKPGSLINIGVLLYGGEIDNTLENVILENGIEYTGILYKNVIEKNCFKIPKNKNVTTNFVPIDKSSFVYKIITEKNDNYNLQCITFEGKNEYLLEVNVIFYTVQFIYNLKDDGQGMNKHPKLLPDIYYLRNINEGDILALNQLEPEDNYKYLSFFLLSQDKIKLLSYICDTYPLCPINSDAIQESKPIRKFLESYSYSFSKDELGKNITPISKRQHIFLIICEKGTKNICHLSFLSYNNNTKIPLNDGGFIYSRKDDENKIYPFLYNTIKPEIYGELFLGIRLYSGDISFNTSNSNFTIFEYKNSKVIYTLMNSDLYISIKANTDSIYEIEKYTNGYSEDLDEPFGLEKNNYLFKFGQKNNTDISSLFFTYNLPEYAAFYPINCNISVEKVDQDIFDENNTKIYTKIPQRYGFFQEIRDIEELENIYPIGYTIKTTDNDYENCLFSAGFFNLRNKINDDEEGIFLFYNISYPFIFEKNYTDPVLFLYMFGNNYSDFSLNFKVPKNNKYNIEFYINNVKLNKTTQFNSNKQMLIELDDWENICDDIKQMCLLSFLLSSENKDESKIDIIISSVDYNQDEEEEPEEETKEEEIKEEEEKREEEIKEEEETKKEEEETKKEEEEEKREEETKKEEEEPKKEEEEPKKEEESENEKKEEEINQEEEESKGGDGNNGKKDDKPSETGIPIVLIIIIVIASLIVLFGVIFMILKCRKKNTNEDIERLNIEKAFESEVPLL